MAQVIGFCKKNAFPGEQAIAGNRREPVETMLMKYDYSLSYYSTAVQFLEKRIVLKRKERHLKIPKKTS